MKLPIKYWTQTYKLIVYHNVFISFPLMWDWITVSFIHCKPQSEQNFACTLVCGLNYWWKMNASDLLCVKYVLTFHYNTFILFHCKVINKWMKIWSHSHPTVCTKTKKYTEIKKTLNLQRTKHLETQTSSNTQIHKPKDTAQEAQGAKCPDTQTPSSPLTQKPKDPLATRGQMTQKRCDPWTRKAYLPSGPEN